MTAGKYLIFYTADFKKEHLCRKLNSIFYCPDFKKPNEVTLKRVSAKKFGNYFLDEIKQKNFKRKCAGDDFYQHYF